MSFLFLLLQVLHGVGSSTEASHNAAAKLALEALAEKEREKKAKAKTVENGGGTESKAAAAAADPAASATMSGASNVSAPSRSLASTLSAKKKKVKEGVEKKMAATKAK